MTQHQIELIKSSWAMASRNGAAAVGHAFYQRLFEVAPQSKRLFNSSVEEQSDKLGVMLAYVINKLDKLDDIIDEVAKLARRHVSYGVVPEHYALVGDVLLWTLAKAFGEDWTEELKDAWVECYAILSTAMINAAGYSANAA